MDLWKWIMLSFVLISQGALAATPEEGSAFLYLEPKLKEETDKFYSFKLEYGQTHASGKSDFMQRAGAAGANYSNGLDEYVLLMDTSYLKTTKGLVDDKRHSYAGYDRYLAYRTWLFFLFDWESNLATGNRYTQLLGLGLKYDILRNKVWKLNIGAAYLRRSKEFVLQTSGLDSDGQVIDLETLVNKEDKVVSARLKLNYGGPSAKVNLIAYYQPALDKERNLISNREEVDYSQSIEASISRAISSKFLVSLAYSYRYDSLRTQLNQSRVTEKTLFKLGYEY